MEGTLRLAALALLLLAAGSISAAASAAVGGVELRGVAPQDEGYYKGSLIRCRDGSGKFGRERLNDGFCDCTDGTDEPGTSACPEGRFFCQNLGHIPAIIFSSRVNDGICDCCDGSDEYESNVTCQNTCWVAGEAARNKLKNKIATYQEGIIVRNKEVEKANEAFAKDEAELVKLKSEEKMLKSLVDKLKEQKERIEKIEEEERVKKENEERRLKEEAEQALKDKKASEDTPVAESDALHGTVEDEHKDHVNNVEADIGLNSDHQDSEVVNDRSEAVNPEDYNEGVEEAEDLDKEQNSDVSGKTDELSSVPTEEKDHSSHETEGLSREELGRLVASRWTGEKVNDKNEPADVHAHDGITSEAAEDSYLGYTSDVEDDRHNYDDNGEDDSYKYDENDDDETDEDFGEEIADHTPPYHADDDKETQHSGRPAWLEKLQKTVKSVFKAFDFFKTPIDISEADRVRKEYNDASSKLSKLKSRISALTEKFKHDFGKQKEFYSFYDQCFETKEGKYDYKVCPFKRASQVEGHSNTNLGNWDKFDGSYRVMSFSGGDRCWNGPDRSLKVRLRCGLKNELTDVDEPSRCEYAAVLSTPAVCVDEKLKELQQKLDNLAKNKPVGHDEL